jgi:hypothetical protein
MSERALDNTNTADAAKTASDIKVSGNPDIWVLACKASSATQGWMKSTKIMAVPGGRVVQVSTEHRGSDGKVTACAEALAFVPDAAD